MSPGMHWRRAGAFRRSMARAVRGTLRWVVTFHGRPRDIALGAAVGMFVAFTPLVGLQMLLAIALATVLRASRAAAIPPCWITNPLTFVPIYAFTYLVGTWFWPGPARSDFRQRLAEVLGGLEGIGFWDLADRVRLLMNVGWDFIGPMFVGGFIVGGLLALPTYGITLWIVRHARVLIPHRQRTPLKPTPPDRVVP